MPVMRIQKYDWIQTERYKYPILWCAFSGELDELRTKLQHVRDITKITDSKTNTTVLGWAVIGNQVAIVNYLLKLCPELLHVLNKYGANPLFLCSVSGNVDMFKRFVQEGLSPLKKILNMDTILMLTAARGHYDLTRYIAMTYPSLLSKQSKFKMDAFLYSCYSGSVEIFNFMLQNNFDASVSDIDSVNCVMIAAYCGHGTLLRHVLSKAASLGIDIQATDIDGFSAATYAAMSGNEDVQHQLSAAGLESPTFWIIFKALLGRIFGRVARKVSEEPLQEVNAYLDLFRGPKEKYRHIRVVFVGPENVGKTTLCFRLQNKLVDISARNPTLGAELYLQMYEIGLDTKQWTSLGNDEPETTIHKRLGDMLRNTTTGQSDDPDKDLQSVLTSSEDTEQKMESKPSTAPKRYGKTMWTFFIPVLLGVLLYWRDPLLNIIQSVRNKSYPHEIKRFGMELYAGFLEIAHWYRYDSYFPVIEIGILICLLMLRISRLSPTVLKNSRLVYMAWIPFVAEYLMWILSDYILEDLRLLPGIIRLAGLLYICMTWLHYLISSKRDRRFQDIDEIVKETNHVEEAEEVHFRSSGRKERVAFLSLWDMGGDVAFQATNSIFISAHGVYILTFRASDYFAGIMEIERLKNWIRNIGVYSSRMYNRSKLQHNHPPIIIVGTHMDEVDKLLEKETDEEREKKLAKMRKSMCSIRELTKRKKEGDFSFLRFCTVNNTINNEDEYEKIKNYILEAATYQDQWERELPGNWLPLERELLKERKTKNVLTFQGVKDINERCEYPIQNDEEMKIFLEYLHSTRSVLYFREYEQVIINPQWIVNAFRVIVTDNRYIPKGDLLNDADFIKYTEDAILTVGLAKHLWNLEEDKSFIQNADVILAFMEEFGLLAKPLLCTNNDGHPTYYEDYIVPSRLRTAPDPQNIHDLLTAPGTCCSKSLCVVFEEVFTPQELFERIYAGIIKAFQPMTTSSQRKTSATNQMGCADLRPDRHIYKTLGCFQIDELYNIIVRMQWETSMIVLTMFSSSESNISQGEGVHVRKKVEKIIHNTLQVSRQEHLQYKTQLHCSFFVEVNDKPRDKDGILRSKRGLPCGGESCSQGHRLSRDDWHVWYTPDIESSTSASNGEEMPERKFENKYLQNLSVHVAMKLGFDWELVLMHLNVSQRYLQRLKMDHHDSITQITKALIFWRDSYPVNVRECKILEDLHCALKTFDYEIDGLEEEIEISKKRNAAAESDD